MSASRLGVVTVGMRAQGLSFRVQGLGRCMGGLHPRNAWLFLCLLRTEFASLHGVVSGVEGPRRVRV